MLYLHRPNRTTKRMRLGIHNEAARVKAEHDERRAVAGYIPRAGSEPVLAESRAEPMCQPDLFNSGCEFCLPEVPCPLHWS
mgnify:CR=1 FL=1